MEIPNDRRISHSALHFGKEVTKHMMRSLSSAVAGLRAHQTKMDVIGNNIANVNTYGFKASRTTFADVYYQNLSSGSSPRTATGGTNPTQIGYGSAVATIDVLNTQSGAASTDRALDVYITGEGFLVTQDPNGNFMYTRLGNLGFDAAGNLIDCNGNFMMGFPQNSDGTPRINADGTAQSGELKPIQVNPEILDKLTGISISTSGEIIGIMEGHTQITLASGLPDWISAHTATIPEGSAYQGGVKLNTGGLPSETALAAAPFGMTGAKVSFGDVAIDATSAATITIENGLVTFEGQTPNSDGTLTNLKATGTLDSDGKIVLKNSAGKTVMTIETTATSLTNTTTSGTITPVTVSLVNQYQISTTDKGGNIVTEGKKTLTAGTTKLTMGDISFDITADDKAFAGTIGRVGLSEGEKLNIGCLVLAKFRNAAALQQAGNSNYVTSPNSGDAIYVRPGLEGTGALKANYLEMSNVDISKEFTDMITTQRGFQANTRIVTVSDEMLLELVNLKR